MKKPFIIKLSLLVGRLQRERTLTISRTLATGYCQITYEHLLVHLARLILMVTWKLKSSCQLRHRCPFVTTNIHTTWRPKREQIMIQNKLLSL